MKVNQDMFSAYPTPEHIKRLLMLAVEHWENLAAFENYITQAVAEAKAEPEILLAIYRYFYQQNKNAIAHQIAKKVLENVKQSENIPQDWGKLKGMSAACGYERTYAATGLFVA